MTHRGDSARQPTRILITGINYAPEQTGNAPYTTGLAEHLARTGFDVTVVTGMPYYPEWRVPAEYGRRLRAHESRNGVSVHRMRTYVPRKQDAIRRIGFEAGFFLNGLTLRGYERPDAVIGIVPSLGGAGLAALLARRFRAPYGLMFQDLVGAAAQQSGMPGGNTVARATQALEGRAARGAAAVSVISEGFTSYLVDLGVDPSRIRHIRNWSHIQRPDRARDDVRRELGWTPDETIVLHAGAMGLKQGLDNVVHAARLAQTRMPGVRFVFMGDGNQRARLQELAAGLTNVTFLPPSDASAFPGILAAADVLLINERASLLDMALPSKLTSYLMAGRPIVAAVSPEGWTAREVRTTGAGLVVPAEDPAALVDAVATIAADPDRARQMGEAGPRYAESRLSAPVILEQASAFIRTILNATDAQPHAVATSPAPGESL